MFKLNQPLFGLLLLVASCGGSQSNTSERFATIKGIAQLGPINNGTIKVYPLLQNGQPDTNTVLGTGTTDVDGNYSFTLSSSTRLPAGSICIAQVTSGSYLEESSGKTVTIAQGTSLNAIFPCPDSSQGAVTINVSITALTEVAAAKGRIDIAVEMAKQLLGPNGPSDLPADLKTLLQQFVANPAEDLFGRIAPLLEKYLDRPEFETDDFRSKMSQASNNSNYDVSKLFGLPSIIGVSPLALGTLGNLDSGDQNAYNYSVFLAAISQQANQQGTDSIALMKAISATLVQTGSLIPIGKIKVKDAEDRDVEIEFDLGKFNNLTKGIASGEIKIHDKEGEHGFDTPDLKEPKGIQTTHPDDSNPPEGWDPFEDH